MKLERKQKSWIALGIAASFIFYGLLDMMFKFNISTKTVNNVGMVLMIIAFGLLFSGRKPKQNSSDETETNSSIQDASDKTEIGGSTQDTEANSSRVEPDEQNQVDQNDKPNTK